MTCRASARKGASPAQQCITHGTLFRPGEKGLIWEAQMYFLQEAHVRLVHTKVDRVRRIFFIECAVLE